MKEYPREYEYCYTREEVLKKCKIEHVSNDMGVPVSEYRDFYRKGLQKIMEGMFDAVVRFVWLQSRFSYMGYKRKKIGNNYYIVDGAHAVFLRHHVGMDYRLFTRTFFYPKIASYMKDLFKDFHGHNPFEEPEYYKYPFKHISLDFFTVVAQMPDRMELLQLAEERKMKWDEFIDYAVNHALCHNDEIKNKMYTFISPRTVCPPYIRNNFKKFKAGDRKGR